MTKIDVIDVHDGGPDLLSGGHDLGECKGWPVPSSQVFVGKFDLI